MLLSSMTLEAKSTNVGREVGVEFARIVSAIGIVVFHVGAPYAVVGYSGLPMLVAIGTMFAPRQRARPGWESIRERAARLLVPWVFWSAAYALMKLAKSVVLADGAAVSSGWMTVLVGAHVHLWYLPFAFLFTVAIGVLLDRRRASERFWSNWLPLFTMLLWSSSVLMDCVLLAVPFAQWVFSLPAVGLGLCLIGARKDGQFDALRLLAIVTVGIAVLGLEALAGRSRLLIPYGMTCVLVIPTVLARWPAGRVISEVARASFAVYLIHPAIHEGLVRLGWGLTGGQTVGPVVLTSFLLGLVLQRTPLRRFV